MAAVHLPGMPARREHALPADRQQFPKSVHLSKLSRNEADRITERSWPPDAPDVPGIWIETPEHPGSSPHC